jgi:hypothetical protein
VVASSVLLQVTRHVKVQAWGHPHARKGREHHSNWCVRHASM